MVPLQGAIAGCHCSVLWLSGRGAIAGCHCSVLWFGVRVTTNFGGVDVVSFAGGRTWSHCRVPLQCALVGGGQTLEEWTWCHCWVPL